MMLLPLYGNENSGPFLAVVFNKFLIMYIKHYLSSILQYNGHFECDRTCKFL